MIDDQSSNTYGHMSKLLKDDQSNNTCCKKINLSLQVYNDNNDWSVFGQVTHMATWATC